MDILRRRGKVSVIDSSAILNRSSNRVIPNTTFPKVILLEVEGCLRSKSTSAFVWQRQTSDLSEAVTVNRI